jgi:hypothetical protein
MSKIIAIRVHPKEPCSGDDFTGYLKNLTIKVFDVSLDNTKEGELIDTAQFLPAHLFDKRIFQHIKKKDPPPIPPIVEFEAVAVATAIIIIPENRLEFRTSDIRLEVSRINKVIIDRRIDYNVAITEGTLPDPFDRSNPPNPHPRWNPVDETITTDPNYLTFLSFLSDILQTSMYLALPEPGRDLDTDYHHPEVAYVDNQVDGSPPNFTALKKAVMNVLSNEIEVDIPPATEYDLNEKLAALTLNQCRHIANEIAWNRQLDPIPSVSMDLFENMYTGPYGDTDSEKMIKLNRKMFEGELLRYYSQHAGESEKLTAFVASLSAAVFCERKSKYVKKVGMNIPIIIDSPDSTTKIKKAEIIFRNANLNDNLGDLGFSFSVPAEFFYALGASYPPEVMAEQRYQIAILKCEEDLLKDLIEAADAGIIKDSASVLYESSIAIPQASRRIHALGIGERVGCEYPLTVNTVVKALIDAWLKFQDPGDFWMTTDVHNYDCQNGHLDLVLCIVTANSKSLMNTIRNRPIYNTTELMGITDREWYDLFTMPGAPPLPQFTAPGTTDERIAAFIRHLRKFFDVTVSLNDPDSVVTGLPPVFRQWDFDPIQKFIESYNNQSPTDPFSFGSNWDPSKVDTALHIVFPSDIDAQNWLLLSLNTISELFLLTEIPSITIEFHFSLMEALYSRGYTGIESVSAVSEEDFRYSLMGSVAHDYAKQIYQNPRVNGIPEKSQDTEFQPVNPDGTLVNCIPLTHHSPLGPNAYLQEMLKVSDTSTCEAFLLEDSQNSIAHKILQRRGPLGKLHITRANFATPLPMIDLVNECLENLAADVPNTAGGTIYDTNSKELGSHKLVQGHNSSDEDPESSQYYHNPAILFAALPEHSSPATPVKKVDAYKRLKSDFSSHILPYSQPLDICRSYLRYLRTNRYKVMRRFRKDITEFVHDPDNEPTDFQKHLWRYPVRIEIAREYLGITPEEYDQIFSKDISSQFLHEFYGFWVSDEWLNTVRNVAEFLKRTGLTYCEFLDLWRSDFVRFKIIGEKEKITECDPCCPEKYRIRFENPADPEIALKKIAIFIRLWRKLQEVDNAKYTFTQLKDICDVLKFYLPDGSINTDFIRQLAAFQMLRDHFSLKLTDNSENLLGSTGADRLHILALWVGITASKWNWAVDHFVHQIQHYAHARHKRGTRIDHADFIKLLAENLDPLSYLAGFNSDPPTDTWHALPTHSLRFAEVLAKMYASDFSIGEILFICTSDNHLRGDDPFALQTINEAYDFPFDLPDDEDKFSLWNLRRKLLEIDISDEEVDSWTWTKIVTSIREDFGYEWQPSAPDPLNSLGEHFFPTILESCGYPVDSRKRQYHSPLTVTSSPMWNSPPDGPFHYSNSLKELLMQLPLTDESVVSKLSRVRQLNQDEIYAVREIYFQPRVDLVNFAFMFSNFKEAEKILIEEGDEQKRWAYFRREFALCFKRCNLIAEHLKLHVAAVTGKANDEGIGPSWHILKHLLADENGTNDGNWELPTGEMPDITWKPKPSGGSFGALLGLTGTGLIAEFVDEKGGKTVWREFQGPIEVFGSVRNDWNAPVPTILPSLQGTFSFPDLQLLADLRNGFALANSDGRKLGGAAGFKVKWQGALLIEKEGAHAFWAGAPTPDNEKPDFESAMHCKWRVTLKRGQKTWVLLNHRFSEEDAPCECSLPLFLRDGTYQFIVEFEQHSPIFDKIEHLIPHKTGFQIKYSGPDTADRLIAIPFNRLFLEYKDITLNRGIEEDLDIASDSTSMARQFLHQKFTSSIRDIRRTYQRAFKSLLFSQRFDLSAKPVADDGQSELGYIISHPHNFIGLSFIRNVGEFETHRAFFNFNFLPLSDNYYSASINDNRANPSLGRSQAIFDWWERIFDYTMMCEESQRVPEYPVWLLFHEAFEKHPDDPAHLLRHLGVDLTHAGLLLNYYSNPLYSLSSPPFLYLADERWAIRVWQGEKWIRDLVFHFAEKDIRKALTYLWAEDDPSLFGNENLTKFVRDGCIENGEPRRYEDIKHLNDGLRERARHALLAYLCGMNRVNLPSGTSATEPKDLSDLLLLDMQAGLCEKTTRVEEGITAVQTYIQRSRLGLVNNFHISPEFILLWDRRFASFNTWESCKRREMYRENWIEFDELHKARNSETYQFLESELRRATLTRSIPGGLEYWPDHCLPAHHGLAFLQKRDLSLLSKLRQPCEGFDLLGTPDWHGRHSWLASFEKLDEENGTQKNKDENPKAKLYSYYVSSKTDTSNKSSPPIKEHFPLWIEAAIRLGTQFIRVAAAGEPPASTHFKPRHPERESGCCNQCGKQHPAFIDEYYFWLLDSRYFTETLQNAVWETKDWHSAEDLPTLLKWDSKPMVHLVWVCFHNGELQQPKHSDEGVRLRENIIPNLEFLGRSGDSLFFEVKGGIAPEGFPRIPSTGFRYDLSIDSAIILPQLAGLPVLNPVVYPGDLIAYPYFVYFNPGHSLDSLKPFSPAILLGDWLRVHCRFEAALKWYLIAFNPLHEDCAKWITCMRSIKVDQESPLNPVDSSIMNQIYQDRSIIIHYIETLLQWADAKRRRNTVEAYQASRLILDAAARILGEHPTSVIEKHDEKNNETISSFKPLPPPINPRLLNLYDLVYDHLEIIHACLNNHRLTNERLNIGMPYFGNKKIHNSMSEIVQVCDIWKDNSQICPDEDWCCPQSPYRFLSLISRDLELINKVCGLGTALLSAMDKGDSEYLAYLRSGHERQLISLSHEIRQNQWRDADWQVQALQKTKEIAQTRRRYYESLILRGLNSGEIDYQTYNAISTASRTAGNISEIVAQAMGVVPDTWYGMAGMMGTPLFFQQLPIGTKMAGVLHTTARIANTLADIASTTASLRLTEGGWNRREEEWRHQVEVLDIELEQIERQILGAERRRDIALRDLNNHQQQEEHSIEIHDFMRDKFTNHQRYLWLLKETAALYFQMYELALHVSRQAQKSFNYEKGYSSRKFIPSEMWDDLQEGLHAGERLELAVRQMEIAYRNENTREYEITKHISLRLHFPLAFLSLKLTGRCEIEIPEWIFDLDYPGQYMRRIKSISITVPCVIGPYTGINSRVTLISSTTRISPNLSLPPEFCCKVEKPNNGYRTWPDDPRIVKVYTATEAIATSTGQNDTGMFELNFHDERYLPFEFSGAISHWRIELPPENNPFDFDSLSDVILHLNYTSREGGDELRYAANEVAQYIIRDGVRLFDLKYDLSDSWRLFQNDPIEMKSSKYFDLKLNRTMFPYLHGHRSLQITRMDFFFEDKGANPGAYRTVEFRIKRESKKNLEEFEEKIYYINCIASCDWPTLYHGIIKIRLPPLHRDEDRTLGRFNFKDDIRKVSNAYLLCKFEVK